jgi:hypothetical protein
VKHSILGVDNKTPILPSPQIDAVTHVTLMISRRHDSRTLGIA